MKRVGIWIRVSTDMQAQSDSPEIHEKRARAHANEKGWKVVDIYHLEGLSGKEIMPYSETQRMLKDIERGHIEALVFSKIARLSRNTVELLIISEHFRKNNADLIALDEPIDTTTPSGRFFFTQRSGMAQWEREEISSRVKASTKARAKMGKSLGGQAPYGYTWVNKVLELDTDEAPVRKYMFELFKKHKRKKTVCRILNEEGYRTRKGSHFSTATLTRLLTDTIAKGKRRMYYTESLGNGKQWKMKPKDQWVFHDVPPIVSDGLFDEVQDIIEEQTRTRKKPRQRFVKPFTGFLYCEDCNEKMVYRTQITKYTCPKCFLKITKDDLENIFLGELKSHHESHAIQDSMVQSDKQELQLLDELLSTLNKKKSELSVKLERLVELNVSGELPTEGFNHHYEPSFAQYKQIEETLLFKESERDSLVQNMKESSTMNESIDRILNRWSAMSNVEQREEVKNSVWRINVGKRDIEVTLITKKANALLSLNGVKKGTHECPCGYYNHPEKECVCAPGAVQKYLNKISGPLMDRIDLHVEVTPVKLDELMDPIDHGHAQSTENSVDIRARVITARELQTERFSEHRDINANAQMPSNMVKQVCQLDSACQTLLKTAMEKLNLSARAYDRILKVSRTIADLGGKDNITIEHLAEAIQYRSLDRESWGMG